MTSAGAFIPSRGDRDVQVRKIIALTPASTELGRSQSALHTMSLLEQPVSQAVLLFLDQVPLLGELVPDE